MIKPVTGADATRQALIDAALQLFGERGYDAVSTRELAERASANIGSIAYHFGGKPGLRLACAEHVATRLQAQAAPAIDFASVPISPAAAVALMEAGMERFGRFVVSSREASIYAAFIIREVMQPGEIVDHLYERLIGTVHQRLCHLFGTATGRGAETQEVRAAVFSLLGQMLYFRIAQPIVLRRMDWPEVGPAQADFLVSIFKTNLKGLIAAYRKDDV